jgi:lipopolysaccharide transport system ATP-binding protein
MNSIIKIENLSKQYRLGTIGTGTLKNDLKRWSYKIRGKEDPFLKIGESNNRSKKGESEFVWALRDINLEVEAGEVLGIIGKNGAGKSTLLKILSKVTGPTTGSIAFNGRIGSLLEVGTGFHPELTGRENIFLNGAILGMTKAEIRSKLDEIVSFSGCERYIDTPVKRYSSGMKVRLGFAVAAHLEPEILVVDEVLAVGDAEFQKKAIGKMQDVAKHSGRTVLFVSHNMVSISQLCTKVCVLNEGTVQFHGDTMEGIDNYISNDIASENYIPLIDRTDRKGTGTIQITGIKLISDLNSQNVAFTGKPAKFELSYKNNGYEGNNVRLSLIFKDKYRDTLFTATSRQSNPIIELNQAEGTIACEIPYFPLTPDKYIIDVWCGIGPEASDAVINALGIDVQGIDVYNSGFIPSRNKHGRLMVEHSWK